MITAEEVLEHKGSKIVSVDKETTVIKAIEKMVEHSIGAVSITENDEIIGIWTERDLLRNSIVDGFDINTTKVCDCMLSKLHKMPHSANLLELQGAFLGFYSRYLFITKDDDIIGMISGSDLMKTHLNKQKEEVDKLKSYVSMEYYENWSWDAKKK